MLISSFSLCLVAVIGVSAVPHVEEKRQYDVCATVVSKAPRRQAISDCASFRYFTTYPCAITGLCAGPTLLPSQYSTCETGYFQPTNVPTTYTGCQGDSFVSACANIGVVAQTSYRPRPYCINGPTTTIVQTLPQTVLQTTTKIVTASPTVTEIPTATLDNCAVATAQMSNGNTFQARYNTNGFRGDSSRLPCDTIVSDYRMFTPYASESLCRAVLSCTSKVMYNLAFKSFTLHQSSSSKLWTCIGYKSAAAASLAWVPDSTVGTSLGYVLQGNEVC